MFGLRAGCIVAEEPFDPLWIAVPNLLERFAHVGLSKAHGRGFELGSGSNARLAPLRKPGHSLLALWTGDGSSCLC